MADTRVSDQAVKDATGKQWDEWFEVLDKAGASKLNHTRIAGYLQSQYGVKPWWSQTVAVTYEKERGLRVLGQTSDAGFQVGAQKTMSIKPDKAWELLTGSGLGVWLGRCDDFELEKGFEYQTAEGVSGKVGVVNRLVNWRMSWKPKEWEKASALQVRVTPAGEFSTIGFHHERLPDSRAREEMKQRWQAVLVELEAMI